MPDITSVSVNTIRTLCMDAVQQANSGHPGTPMAMAPVVYALWQDYLRFDPEDPIWPNRDRFIPRRATPRRCCMLCCTWQESRRLIANTKHWARSRSPWRTSKSFANSKANAPAIPSTVGRLGWRQRLDRLAKVLRQASEWPSLVNGSPNDITDRTFQCSITTFTPWLATGA
jgi:hypothetical protein